MNKLLRFTATIVTTALLGSCVWGDKVEVPPAFVGKVLTKNGYKPETVPPSKFRLDACIWYCDKLVLLEAADKGMKEEFNLFMPKDQLNMAFDVRFTMSVASDEKSINAIYNRIPARGYEGYKSPIISANKVYETYGRPVLRDVIRQIVAQYSINEVATNRERINAEVFNAVTEALKGSSLNMKRLALADVQFPKIITTAKEAAAERRIKIEEAEAQKQVRLVELQAELEQARMEKNIRKERAQAALAENQIFAKSVTKEYLEYKKLEVLGVLANNPNTVFVPYKALDTLGLQQAIFNNDAEVRKIR